VGAIADLDSLINLTTDGGAVAGDRIWMHKWDRVAGTAITFLQNRDYSLWTFDGQPSAGVAPGGTAAVPDNTTAGGLRQVDPTGGRQKWLHAMVNWLTNAQCSVLLYDRLLHISGLSGTVTTAQTVGGAITRYTGAEAWNNQAWVEIYSPLGATATTISMNYVDQDGNAAASPAATTVIGGAAFAEQCRMFPIALAAGDSGVRSVTDVTLAATTGTAGDFGITIVRPLAMLNVAQVGGGGIRTYLESMPEIKAGACLALMIIPHTVAVNRFGMGFAMVEA
jgi:hypothetical protein